MEIFIIIFLLILVGVLMFLSYKMVKWVITKKEKIIDIILLPLSIIASLIIYQLSFVKMEFIQSNVYPDLYLIKHPIKDKDSLNTTIKEFVKNKVVARKKVPNYQSKVNYSLRFYEYYQSWSINLFADAGTAYFIENEEDPSGFVVEELTMYRDYKLATFSFKNCKNLKNLKNNQLGILKYYYETNQNRYPS